MWCIPPEQNAAFAANMEDVLEAYSRPYDGRRPVVCTDEQPIELHDDSRQPIPMSGSNHTAKVDHGYVRKGARCGFLFNEPLGGWRRVDIPESRKRDDWAHQIKKLVDEGFPDAEVIVLVCDNPNTHNVASLYQAFPPAGARRIWERPELHHTPKFTETDTATILPEMIGAEYQTKISKKLAYRLRKAHLGGCPQELNDCVDSSKREYLPSGITGTLSTLNFIGEGLNVCMLGPADSGKSFYSKAIGIRACRSCKVCYFEFAEFVESLVALKCTNYDKCRRKARLHERLDLLIIDDFLLNTVTDERETKVFFDILNNRNEHSRSTIICSQREPKSWASMMPNDEVSADSLLKRATKHYTVMINLKPAK